MEKNKFQKTHFFLFEFNNSRMEARRKFKLNIKYYSVQPTGRLRFVFTLRRID